MDMLDPQLIGLIVDWITSLKTTFATFGWLGLLPAVVFGLVQAYKSPLAEHLLAALRLEKYAFSAIPGWGKALVVALAAVVAALSAHATLGIGTIAAIITGILSGLVAVLGHKALPAAEKRDETAARIAVAAPGVAKPLALIVRVDPELVAKIKAAKETAKK